MAAPTSTAYAAWRAQARSGYLLHELEKEPPEALLQQVWLRQRLRRASLTTLDGRPITIIHPGFWNREPGPDFRSAIIKIGDGDPVTGDVEIDLLPIGWTQHGHAGNPAYARVALHVVWDAAKPAAHGLPTLALKPHLDAAWRDLAQWLDVTELPLPEGTLGRCAGPLRDLGAKALENLLFQAAQLRLESKAEELEARARQSGWEQALWEGVLGGLGYKHNTWPMRRVAEVLPQVHGHARNRMSIEARFLGVSGLLPEESNGLAGASGAHVKELWSHWWRDQDQFAGVRLPRGAWRLDTVRPANHPQRRLALAAQWASDSQFIERLEQWFLSGAKSHGRLQSLTELLQGEGEGYWTGHWTFRSAPLARAQPLIGKDRVSDLAVNVVIPWFWTRARAGRNQALQTLAEEQYFSWPASQDNSALKQARARLFGGQAAVKLDRAALQQGLLQITRDFCDRSNAMCDDCLFPQLVRSWPGER